LSAFNFVLSALRGYFPGAGSDRLRLPVEVREAEEVECLRIPEPPLLSISGCEMPELGCELDGASLTRDTVPD
jgi:hypothetical protein